MLMHEKPCLIPILNRACLIILSYITVHNCDTYVYVSSATESNADKSYVILIIKQHLHLEIAIRKIFNNGYRNYRNLNLANIVNEAENDLENTENTAENVCTDWQFSVF